MIYIIVFFAYAFLIIGGVVFCLILSFLITSFLNVLKEAIIKIKWKYKYRHRFDKRPIAKCYCIDCRYFGNNNFYYENKNKCFIHKEWQVTDNCFCWEADPCKNFNIIKIRNNK